MVIQSTLTPEEFRRYELNRHFRRSMFYFYAFIFAVLTVYALTNPTAPIAIYVVAPVPLLAYSIGGWAAIIRRSNDPDLPAFLPMRYELTTSGVRLHTPKGDSSFTWSDFKAWRKALGVYELTLQNGLLLVFSEAAVPQAQVKSLDDLLKKQIQDRA